MIHEHSKELGKRTNCIPSMCPLLPLRDDPPQKIEATGWEKTTNFMDNPNAIYSKILDAMSLLSERLREHHRVQSDTAAAEQGFVLSEDFHSAPTNVTSSNTCGSAVNSHFENTGKSQFLCVLLLNPSPSAENLT